MKGICLILALTICAVYISGASPRGISLQTGADGKSYIKWVDFGITEAALSDAVRLGIKSHDEGHAFAMTELLAYLGARYGGDFFPAIKKPIWKAHILPSLKTPHVLTQ